MIINRIKKLRTVPIFKDSFWAVTGSMIGRGASLLAGIIVARLLGKELFGEYGTIKNTLTYAAIVSTFGLGYTATKFIADYLREHPEKIRNLVNVLLCITIVIGLLLTLLVSIFSSRIAQFLEAPHLEGPLTYFSVLVLFNALTTTQTAILSGFKRFRDLAVINAWSGIVTFVVSIILTFYYGMNGAIIALLISFIFQSIYSKQKTDQALSSYTNICKVGISEIKNIFSFSTPIALQESLYTIIHWVELMLMVKFANYGEVGLSAAASTWKSIVIFIPGVLKNVMFSYLSSETQHERLVKSLLKYNLIASLLPAFVFIIGSPIIVSMYGNKFEGLSPVLMVSLCASVIICVSEVYCYEFISVGKPWIVFTARLIRDSITIILCYLVLINTSQSQAFYTSLSGLLCHLIFLCILSFIYYNKSNKK